MKHINKLKAILNDHLHWHKSRIDCLAKILIALMVVQTVNLTKLAIFLQDRTSISIRYRRLQRFFQHTYIEYNFIAAFIMKIFCFDQQKYYLTMDRTNWKWGKKDINILFLGIVYKGIAIPIYWVVLNRPGNSNANQRAALVKRFVDNFGKENILGLLADREFVGKKWFGWLVKQQIRFYIRIKSNLITTNAKGLEVDIAGLFYGLKVCEKKFLQGRRKVHNCQLYLSGACAPTGELVIIASNVETDNALENYYHRWEIETLFQCLKSRGFCFEDTHITNRSKIKKLIVVLAIAFCWAHKIGEWRCENEKEIKLKKHARLAQSIFRYGLDLLQDALAKLGQTVRPITKLIKLLARPPTNSSQVIGIPLTKQEIF